MMTCARCGDTFELPGKKLCPSCIEDLEWIEQRHTEMLDAYEQAAAPEDKAEPVKAVLDGLYARLEEAQDQARENAVKLIRRAKTHMEAGQKEKTLDDLIQATNWATMLGALEDVGMQEILLNQIDEAMEEGFPELCEKKQ